MSSSEQLTPFGHSMLKHFLLDPNYKNLNHASFGTYPVQVRDALHKFQYDAEARPDPFVRWEQPRALDEARVAVSKVLDVPTKECVFVKNATTGVNTVLRNLVFNEGDAIIYFATTYGAMEKTIIHLSESTPVRGLKVEYQFPISHEELVKRFRDVVAGAKQKGLNVRVAVFDTIVSMPGVRFPFEKLVEACREEGILSLIDGAHGVGQIQLNLGLLSPDFFVSNCHKWLYTPRGCAVLYVPVRNQHLLRTSLPTSWGFIPKPDSPQGPRYVLPAPESPKTEFELLFQFVASTDDSPYLCTPAAVKFRQDVCGGEERIYTYLEELAHEAGDIIAAALGTEVLQEPDLQPGQVSQIRHCAMATIRLPFAIGDSNSSCAEKTPSSTTTLSPDAVPGVIDWMQKTMVDRYGTITPVFDHGGWLWTRVSAQIYLEKSDFEWVAGVLKELCEKVAKGEMDA
ncbi:aminotransferase family protein [Paecilomyces variotii No. 5]|uniref:Aminotransferase family protein n=1 Tax=Byssochlamys spectabilis (strain No. 5 / NBRC 109023) TaxID=1356009 RepID=V5F8Y1_BYSSN|nr:aminotransferase family protein [Paecilomyces variotii No. 5]